ncbi:CpaF family protein [Actinomadura rayongensis]|uniref:CpaF family protein n=1 Tax=Actinomadura rayongensis TaxID=1429076 RepID=A0A6I4WCH2_9ACTN|nr:ATPase, T2SS/T4P/T4SS family [Actinomadura rayongensis]MXQ65626.1 CpaF family protein [Actinomadura rayongensis]
MDAAVQRRAVREINAAIDEQISQGANPDDAVEMIDAAVRTWINSAAGSGDFALTPMLHRQLAVAVHNERYGLGRLQPLVDDPEVENIDANGFDQVWVSYSDGRVEQAAPIADNDVHLIEMIRRWSAFLGQSSREFSSANPKVRLTLPDGSRMTAVMGVTPRPHLAVRKHRMVDVTLDDLVQSGTIDLTMRAFLGAAVRAKKNVIVSGGMGSGKTTMLRALAAELPVDERIVTIESEYELGLHTVPHRHSNVVPMESRPANAEGFGAVSLEELIELAFRLNARRIIVGEVLGAELLPMLTAMKHGGEGSLCTLHANEAAEVFSRMLILANSGTPTGLSRPETLYSLVGTAVDFVVQLGHRTVSEGGERVNQRFVTEVLEVLPPGEGTEPARTQVFAPGPDGRAVPRFMPSCIDDLVSVGGLDGRLPAQLWAYSTTPDGVR